MSPSTLCFKQLAASAKHTASSAFMPLPRAWMSPAEKASPPPMRSIMCISYSGARKSASPSKSAAEMTLRSAFSVRRKVKATFLQPYFCLTAAARASSSPASRRKSSFACVTLVMMTSESAAKDVKTGRASSSLQSLAR